MTEHSANIVISENLNPKLIGQKIYEVVNVASIQSLDVKTARLVNIIFEAIGMF